MSDKKGNFRPMLNDKGESIKGYEGDYVVHNDKGESIGIVCASFFEDVKDYMQKSSHVIPVIHEIDKYPQGAKSILSEVMLKDEYIASNLLNKDGVEKMIDKLIKSSAEAHPQVSKYDFNININMKDKV